MRHSAIPGSGDLSIELMQGLLIRHEHGARGGTLLVEATVVAGGRARAGATASGRKEFMVKNFLVCGLLGIIMIA